MELLNVYCFWYKVVLSFLFRYVGSPKLLFNTFWGPKRYYIIWSKMLLSLGM
jgi:hypothetical protein